MNSTTTNQFAIRNPQSAMNEAQRLERARNKCRNADEIAAELRTTAPEAIPYAAKVGAWLWITVPNRPKAETLAALKLLGFTWNRNRCAWQNPCGVFRPRANTHDPRQTYGEEPVTA